VASGTTLAPALAATPTSQSHGTSLLVGEFNFCRECNFVLERTPLENDSLRMHLQGYTDLWQALNPA
jgi:hypothetical protein